jgi:hypothetical protein
MRNYSNNFSQMPELRDVLWSAERTQRKSVSLDSINPTSQPVRAPLLPLPVQEPLPVPPPTWSPPVRINNRYVNSNVKHASNHGGWDSDTLVRQHQSPALSIAPTTTTTSSETVRKLNCERTVECSDVIMSPRSIYFRNTYKPNNRLD